MLALFLIILLQERRRAHVLHATDLAEAGPFQEHAKNVLGIAGRAVEGGYGNCVLMFVFTPTHTSTRDQINPPLSHLFFKKVLSIMRMNPHASVMPTFPPLRAVMLMHNSRSFSSMGRVCSR